LGPESAENGARNAFEQLREIELRVVATLTPPEVGVRRFPPRARARHGPRARDAEN